MNLELPNLCKILERLISLDSEFNNRKHSIQKWIDERHQEITENLALIQNPTEGNDLQVLHIFSRDLLMRNIVGEGGHKLHKAFREQIKSKNDLTPEKYTTALEMAGYRWKDAGKYVMIEVVKYFRDDLKWDWKMYLNEAEEKKRFNFLEDPLIKIKNIGYKVRDLALSNFNNNYPAFDLHVIRVISRIGLIAYGWELMKEKDVEIDFGTNPADAQNYLFLHILFLDLAKISGKYTPVDLDRIFWHLGRTKCSKKPDCATCPIQDLCLTGKQRCSNTAVNV